MEDNYKKIHEKEDMGRKDGNKYKGRIKFFDFNVGYGFIESDEIEEDGKYF